MSEKKRSPSRDEKLLNLMFNFSMLMMASFEGAFTKLASGMTEALVEGTNAIGDALTETMGGTSVKTEAPEANSGNDATSEVTNAVAQMFSDMRKQMSANVPLDDPSFKQYIKNPEFDKGVQIVESHDFSLPRFTEKLSDNDLASYMRMLKNGNPEFEKMLQELGDWQKSMPQFPRYLELLEKAGLRPVVVRSNRPPT